MLIRITLIKLMHKNIYDFEFFLNCDSLRDSLTSAPQIEIPNSDPERVHIYIYIYMNMLLIFYIYKTISPCLMFYSYIWVKSTTRNKNKRYDPMIHNIYICVCVCQLMCVYMICQLMCNCVYIYIWTHYLYFIFI